MAPQLISRQTGTSGSKLRSGAYVPPSVVKHVSLGELLLRYGRQPSGQKQFSLLKMDENRPSESQGIRLFIAGDMSVLEGSAIAVIGARKASQEGCRRAARLGRELASRGVTVVSGLAEGIDTAALSAAIDAGGRVAAVIGTPLESAYPASNKRLQELIYREHLLISQFASNSRVYQANFPARNRTMAALSDASVIVEASNSSGSLHQAAECQRLGRWLGIARNMLDNRHVDWPRKFLNHERTHIVESTDGLLSAIYGGSP